MAERAGPEIYSIAAHRGFADALVAGLVPRYREPGFGLARLTLLLPSTRARRTLTEAFIRQFGAEGGAGLLLPRMAVVGDLDLDQTLGPLLDPLGADDIPRAVDPMRRWLALAGILQDELGEAAPKGATLLRLARETARTMDRLLAEEIAPDDLMGERIKDLLGDLAEHWQRSLVTFARVQARWRLQLEDWGAVDTATRRNLLFRHAARCWREAPPATPILAAGITSASPALAALLRVASELPQGAVVLPDLDLTMDNAVWEELGRAGAMPEPGAEPFAKGDAVSHPQYHLKLLLNRMGVNRAEVRSWHRRGEAAAPPERSQAISALFLPPQASRRWIDLPADKRRLAGVRILQSATPEEEAQAIAILVREALETPGKRVAVVTPDRALARRVVAHLARWTIAADDSAGRPLSQTAAGRLILLAAEVAAGGAAPVPLMALLGHPLVTGGMDRRDWLKHTRTLELALRGPRPRAGLEPLAEIVTEARAPGLAAWWAGVEPVLARLLALGKEAPLADALSELVQAGEALAGEALWAREDGRALARFVEDLQLAARDAGTRVDPAHLDLILRDAMEEIAVRPPYGGDSRVAIYGLLESRMARAELVICAGLNEGSWPARAAVDALLAPAVLRALGVPGADFRIGLSAHDLAGALGAPEVVLSRAARDESGPAIPSRFLLRVQALLGQELLPQHSETRAPELARMLRDADPAPPYPRPEPCPTADQRDVAISATALDRLLGDPYQFYAQAILGLGELEALDAEPGPAWQGQTAHTILERWHGALASDPAAKIAPIMAAVMEETNANPLLRALWEPRLLAALEWAVRTLHLSEREVRGVEIRGEMRVDGVRIHGRADRIDRLPGGDALVIVDYKTGRPPSPKQVAQGFALQLGVLGLIARDGGFPGIGGIPAAFEYWSLAKRDKTVAEFGYAETPVDRKTGPSAEEFLPLTEKLLRQAVARYIRGGEPFLARESPDYPGYATYDQLMRLAEWLPHIDAAENAAS